MWHNIDNAIFRYSQTMELKLTVNCVSVLLREATQI
jgi:hypothetical protein